MKKIVILFLFLTNVLGVAQEVKFGKIKKTDLEKQAFEGDASVNAEILYKEQKTKYEYVPGQGGGFRIITKVHERIKIYNQEGLDAANVAIRLYRGGKTDEQVIGLKGITYNLESGKVVKVKMKNESIFKEDLNEYWYAKKFALPAVKKGSVIEYSYKIESPYTTRIDDVYLQSVYPIKELSINIRVPQYFLFKSYLNPHADFTPVINETMVERTISFREEFERSRGDAIKERSNASMNFKERVYKVNKKNIPAFSNEPYITGKKNYLAQVKWDLESIKFPNRAAQVFAKNWEEVTKSIYESSSFGGQLSKTFVKDDVAALVKGLVNRDEKINAIFHLVKSTMKWNNFISIYSNNLKKSYEKGEGNSADINLLLVLMLREAGINANPILLSTKANGIPLFPTRSGFNYVICGVEVQEDVLLFDATEPYTSKDVLPTRVINWQGRMLRKDGSSVWVSLEPKRNTKVTTMINAAITEDLALEGKVRSSYSDHSAKSFRTRNNDRSPSELASSTQQDKGDVLIENVVVKNEKDLSKNILKSYEFTANDAVEEIGGALYFSPLLFLADDENIFKQDTRSYPIDFVYPITEKYVVTIAIPAGYEVTSLPENKTHLIQDNIGGFDYQIAQKGSNIQVIMTKKINYSMIPKNYYSVIKNYFSEVVKKETEKVILSKN